jgi:hypothetical protein
MCGVFFLGFESLRFIVEKVYFRFVFLSGQIRKRDAWECHEKSLIFVPIRNSSQIDKDFREGSFGFLEIYWSGWKQTTYTSRRNRANAREHDRCVSVQWEIPDINALLLEHRTVCEHAFGFFVANILLGDVLRRRWRPSKKLEIDTHLIFYVRIRQ